MARGSVAAEGIGFATMNYRARLIGASIRVLRVVPRGTIVECAIALPVVPAQERSRACKAV
jgi:signal transduction histidine kinase